MGRSGFEKKIMAVLDALGVVYEYETEHIKFTQPERARYYVPDIILTTKNNQKIYVELKGKLDREAQHKMRWVKEQNPTLDIRIVFMRDNKMTKSSKKTYTEWAQQHGFPWSVGSIPKEWLEE
jgi:hypothetical protein